MKQVTKILVAVMAISVVAVASAQQPGGGRGQGRGGMRMFGGGGMQSNLMLANRSDVQDDLKLTSDQKSKIRDLQQAQFEKMRSGFTPGQRPDPEQMRATFEKMNKEADAELAKIITPEQVTRIGQIGIQLAKNSAVNREDIQKTLGLSADQIAKIKSLNEKQQAAQQSLGEKLRNQEIDMDSMRASFEKNRTILDEELGKILTEAQRTKLKELGGAPFKADPNAGGFGGFGGGRGRGGGGGRPSL